MSDLPTLKDIKYRQEEELIGETKNYINKIYYICYADEIQDATRKWIEELEAYKDIMNPKEELKTGNEELDRQLDFDYYHLDCLIDWIKHFFNLDEAEE